MYVIDTWWIVFKIIHFNAAELNLLVVGAAFSEGDDRAQVSLIRFHV